MLHFIYIKLVAAAGLDPLMRIFSYPRYGRGKAIFLHAAKKVLIKFFLRRNSITKLLLLNNTSFSTL
jgi:hypothetical protein